MKYYNSGGVQHVTRYFPHFTKKSRNLLEEESGFLCENDLMCEHRIFWVSPSVTKSFYEGE
ncbi:hypothetical protein CU084_09535 [Bacillus velezensis]|nr:hypothetical protein CU084_09535 [Bacillus velezensis]